MPYISCIKIAGQPIIPPLMTEEKREQCLEFKRKALELERKRLFKQCMDDLTKLQHQTEDLIKSQPVPSHNKHKMSNLKSETIDVSEYSDEGVRIITTPSPLPRLCRSNSYTLDSPSPILLAHMEREAQKCIKANSEALYCDLSPEKTNQDVVVETTIQQVYVNTTEPTKVIDSQDDLSMILFQSLPGNHAKNIVEILEKQREDLQRFNTDECMKMGEETPQTVSVCSSQSLYYSMIGTPEVTDDNKMVVDGQNSRNIQRQLFRNDSEARKEWAASKINAAVRGYLIRRLLRTDKVQLLIATIKDALVCALQLHTADIVIEESDVELHRRLLQQVSAACYAFHDVFFALSIREQMAIIANDRQRLIEKMQKKSDSDGSRISTPRSILIQMGSGKFSR